MRIARLLIYEGTEEELQDHFKLTFIRPGFQFVPERGVTIEEAPMGGLGGRTTLPPGYTAVLQLAPDTVIK